jgi:hypothetical protein
MYQEIHQMTARFRVEIADWQKRLEDLPWAGDRTPTILVRPDLGATGFTTSAQGVVYVSLSLVEGFPDNVAFAILVHERTHLHIASELRQVILRRHSDLDTFFHERVLPDVISRKVFAGSRASYELAKQVWRCLYSDTLESEPVDWNRCGNYIDWVFDQARIGEGVPTDNDPKLNNAIAIRRLGATVTPVESTQTIEDLYAHNTERYAQGILTAYSLADELFTRYQHCCGEPFGIGLIDRVALEENFANYAACAATGLAMDEISRWAPQDPWKMDRIPRLLKQFPSFAQALKRVDSVPSLIVLGREAGLV